MCQDVFKVIWVSTKSSSNHSADVTGSHCTVKDRSLNFENSDVEVDSVVGKPITQHSLLEAVYQTIDVESADDEMNSD